MTTINTRNGKVPLDVALELARREYLDTKRTDIRSMSSAALERRKTAVQEYINLCRIARMTGTIEHAMEVRL